MQGASVKRSRLSVVFVATLLAAAGFVAPLAYAEGGASSSTTHSARGALDFWLGNWTVAAPGGGANATSSVTVELGKCLVVERWNGGRDHLGENFFGYSADDKQWHGLFADNEGRVHVFVDGTVSHGVAQFTGPSHGSQGETILNRVTIRRVSGNQVEQMWEKSTDGGKSWTTAFRGEYTRAR